MKDYETVPAHADWYVHVFKFGKDAAGVVTRSKHAVLAWEIHRVGRKTIVEPVALRGHFADGELWAVERPDGMWESPEGEVLLDQDEVVRELRRRVTGS